MVSKSVLSTMQDIVERSCKAFRTDYFNHDLPALRRYGDIVSAHGAFWIVYQHGTQLLMPYVPGETSNILGASRSVAVRIEATAHYYRDQDPTARFYWITGDAVVPIQAIEIPAHLAALAVDDIATDTKQRVSVKGRRVPVYAHSWLDEHGYHEAYRVEAAHGATIEEAANGARRMADHLSSV